MTGGRGEQRFARPVVSPGLSSTRPGSLRRQRNRLAAARPGHRRLAQARSPPWLPGPGWCGNRVPTGGHVTLGSHRQKRHGRWCHTGRAESPDL